MISFLVNKKYSSEIHRWLLTSQVPEEPSHALVEYFNQSSVIQFVDGLVVTQSLGTDFFYETQQTKPSIFWWTQTKAINSSEIKFQK
jgi:hypothetical protein